MRFLGRFLNPLFAFLGIQLAWIVVVAIWIYWFMGSHQRLRSIAEKYSPDLLHSGTDWFILVEGLLLLVAILIGVYVIFIFWRRQAALNKEQKQFIAQVSHELKSPLASLQLHLETMRRRPLPPEKASVFIDTMLADSDRLRTLIDNLLAANRMEQRRPRLFLRPGDLSEFTAKYFRARQFSLPHAGTMDIEITPGLHARFEAESLETVFRNLLENALLYTEGPPRMRVVLKEEGRFVHFVFADQGRGIEKGDLKRVFRMFYRVRTGRNIRGSGLGLFIVGAVVRLHRGKVWAESEGIGRGTAFHILLPRIEREKE